MHFIYSTILSGLLMLSQTTQGDTLPIDTDLTITDFTQTGHLLHWQVMNDSVMGGRSAGTLAQLDDRIVFSGTTNTDGGGFSSIRSDTARLDLAQYQGIRLRVIGDGRRYTWQLQTSAMFRGRGINYWADFETQAGKTVVVDLPFQSFYPQFRGMRLDGPPLDTSDIQKLGLYIYDKKDGAFSIELLNVSAYLDGR